MVTKKGGGKELPIRKGEKLFALKKGERNKAAKETKK